MSFVFRREEKRARKERKHQKRQKNVSSSTEESPAKVGSCQYFRFSEGKEKVLQQILNKLTNLLETQSNIHIKASLLA